MRLINSIAAIVVTHNRKEMLLESLNAILAQSLPVNTIYIIDNKSTDGTLELLMDNNILNKELIVNLDKEVCLKSQIQVAENSDISIHYLRKNENAGGAGGFYAGLKMAYEDGYSWFWLMDDDGYPEVSCLEELHKNSSGLYFLNSLVLLKTDTRYLANLASVDDFLSINKKNIIYNYAMPFNGTLISRKVVDTIGYPKKEYFIWGDEYEYFLRAKNSNFDVVTVSTALHYHPEFKTSTRKVIFNKVVPIKPQPFIYHYLRNYFNIYYKYNKTTLIKTFILYFILSFKDKTTLKTMPLLEALYLAIKDDFKKSLIFKANNA